MLPHKPITNRFDSDAHGWAELLPPYTPRPAYRGDRGLAWAVIGAGITGLAAARRLAELHPDSEIAILEARCIGQGASGRNSGFAVALSHFSGGFRADKIAQYRRVNRINQAGLDLLRRQVQTHGIDCQWQETGLYHTAADTAAGQEYQHFLRYLEALELAHTPLTREELSQRLGTALYRQGVHVHHGALLQPAALVRGLAARLPPNVQIYEQSPVVSIEPGTALRLHTADGIITAERVLVAVNHEAHRLGLLRDRLLGSTLSGSFTRRLTDTEYASLGSDPAWGVLSLHAGGATVRLTRDRRICLRNTAEYHGGRLLDEARLRQRRTAHRAAFEKRFPQLTHIPFEFSWSGVEGISRNYTNFFGKIADHLYFAGGYNGSGLSRGTAFGTALADYASGAQSALITDCLGSAPAQWIPPRPLRDIGAWYTVRARFRNVGLDR